MSEISEAEKLLDALLELEPGHWLIPRNAGFKSEDLADLLDQGLIEAAPQMGMTACRLISLNEPLVEITPIPGAKRERLYRERDLIAAHEEGAREGMERAAKIVDGFERRADAPAKVIWFELACEIAAKIRANATQKEPT
jgi:hypothetical protein